MHTARWAIITAIFGAFTSPLRSGVGLTGFGFRFSGFGFRVSGFGFWVSGFGFRVSGFGFWISGFVMRNPPPRVGPSPEIEDEKRVQVNSAHARQSSVDFGLSLSHFHCKSLQNHPSLLGSGWSNRIAASVYDKNSESPSIRPICTRCSYFNDESDPGLRKFSLSPSIYHKYTSG